MDVSQELSKGQSDDELKAEDDPFQFSQLLSEHHDESSAASSSRADEDYRGSELSEREMLDLALGHNERGKFSADSDDVGLDLHVDELTSTHLNISDDGLLVREDLHSLYDDPLDSPELPSASNESSQEDVPPSTPSVPSPGKKWSKKGRSERKGGGKKSPDRALVDDVSSEASQSSDVGLKSDTTASESYVHGRDTTDVAHERIMENHAVRGWEKSPDEPSSTDAIRQSNKSKFERGAGEEGFTKEDQGGGFSLTALRSPGRWADLCEEAGTSATISIFKEQEAKNKAEQPTVDGSARVDPGAGVVNSHVKTRELEGQNDQVFDGSDSGDARVSGKGNQKEYETGSKGQRAFEGSRTRDERADSWNTRKEQDMRGKTQPGTSQASREFNWRRRPMESRVGQESPKGTNKSGFDVDNVKDDQQDFRSRAQHGAEPQATHKNWIPRRGLQREGDTRADQKARGKGKQGRESGPQTESMKDVAHQKSFEAGLRAEKEKLFQRSKEFLKADAQKTKQMEQSKRGREELEIELNKNLVFEEGELFYLNS